MLFMNNGSVCNTRNYEIKEDLKHFITVLPRSLSDSSVPSISRQGRKDVSPVKKRTSTSKSDRSSNKSTSERLSTDSSLKKTSEKETKRTFYIGGHNGVALVEKPLIELGMERTTNQKNFFLKWVEIKNRIDFSIFLPGTQIVNHIPSIGCLTTKNGLVQTLREYEKLTHRVTKSSSPRKSTERPFVMSDCFMESFFLNSEKSKFIDMYVDGEMWIVKPSFKNQGKGIYLINSLQQLEEKQNGRTSRSSINCNNDEAIVQKTNRANPKMSQRQNSVKQQVAALLKIHSIADVDLDHLRYDLVNNSLKNESGKGTSQDVDVKNQFVQKKHPSYSEKKEDTVLSFEGLNEYINKNEKERKGLVQDWVHEEFEPTMKEIMLSCFLASKRKLQQNEGMFELLGFDFMIDDNMKVWLIEININPALHTNCSVLKEVIPPIVTETLNMVVEIHDKQTSHRKLNRLKSKQNYQTLFNATSGYRYHRSIRTTSELVVESNEYDDDESSSPTVT